MRPLLLHIICTIALFSSCTWVNDDLSKCPSGTWLKITYTYNIIGADACSHIGDISVLVFDKNDKYVGRVDVDSITLHQDDCMVRMPFPEGSYNFIVYGGATDQKYKCTTLSDGITERSSLSLTLACGSNNEHRGKLNSLFYSNLDNVTIGDGYRVLTASLMKNTNYFSCLLQDESKKSINQEDFAFSLESNNGIMDYTNVPVGTEPICYLPYQQHITVVSDPIPTVRAKLTTLRLMKGDNTTLTIKHVPSGQTILHIPITQYLLLAKAGYNCDEMDDQEYLDRQDSYPILFFIQSSETGIPKICPRISIGSWIVRIDTPELED